MADTFAHGVRRRLQAPRPIAQACSVRSEGTGLEVGRLPTAHRASGPSPAGTQAPRPPVARHSPACPSRRCAERPLGDL